MKERVRRTVLVVFIVGLAALVRVKAALELPVDYDEPIYVGAGMHYAQAMRAGDLGEIVRYDYNFEHPVLVKLLYGGGIALLGAGPEGDLTPQEHFTFSHERIVPRGRFADDALTLSRMISVLLGVALVALVAWVEPFAGLALALHTMSTKYTAQAYLEALPALASALCVLACARSGGRRNRWFWLAALALGATAAGKYIYLVVGLVVAAAWLWDVRRGSLRWRDLLLFGLVALLAFLALDPILWANPPGRLLDSLTYHSAYTESTEVTRYSFAWWKPLDYMSHSYPTQWHAGVFFFPFDEPIFVVGLIGLLWLSLQVRRRPDRSTSLILAWFLVGALFLFVWPTKWPQYTLVTATPLCLAFGLVVAEGWRRLRQDRAYWGDLTYNLLPREFWVAMSVLALLLVVLMTWRAVVRHRRTLGWTTFERQTSPLPSNVVRAVALDPAGRVWAGTARGVAVLELPPQGEPVWSVYNQGNSGLPDDDVQAITAGQEGQMWIATERGLARFDIEDGDWTSFTSQNSPLRPGTLNDVTLAPDGSVWVATEAGAATLAPDGTWQAYDTSNSGLCSDVVFDVAIQDDQTGKRAWFATDQGVSVLDLEHDTWTHYDSANSGLAWDGVSGITVDAQGWVWCATFGRGISALSPQGEWRNYNVGNSDLPWSIVTTVAPGCRCGERAAWLWFGTEGPGASLGQQLAAYEPPPQASDGAGRWHAYGYKNSGLPDSAVSDIAVQCGEALDDPASCNVWVWIATHTAGLALYQVPPP
jgi:4-amino-4-deoxy-L-arabinose transferase-like glycosyltransferase